MSFGPQALSGASCPGTQPAQVDYRLARRHLVSELKRGRLSRLEVCDAHPELLRAARHAGRPSAEDCPVCESEELVLVSYAFGPRLPAHGRCVASGEELAKLARRGAQLTCYVVEVCLACSWNHLTRAFSPASP